MTQRRRSWILLGVALTGVAAGVGLAASGRSQAADAAWGTTAAIALVPLLLEILGEIRKRRPGVDLVALLAIGGALVLGEYLAGALIGLMLATGRTLESYARSRAERELTALLAAAPLAAHRYRNGEVETVAVDAVRLHDRLLVKPGEVIPVDGVVAEGVALIDESTVTGESVPIRRAVGERVSSGTVNVDRPIEMWATADAASSTYAGIVRLVAAARASKAPFERLADRYALLFIPVTLFVAGAAWIWSGDPVRAVAVLVVATPCPLLLAAPVAIVSGVSRSARRGVIVKGGGPLETLAQGEHLLFDKTGTLTIGEPELASILAFEGAAENEILGLAASVDQASSHVLAAALVKAARERGLPLAFPDASTESPGAGVAGTVAGRSVRVGSLSWATNGAPLTDEVRGFRRRVGREMGSTVYVALDGKLAGALVLADRIRPESARTMRRFKHIGISTITMLTGDHPVVAESVGAALGVDRVLAERSPAEKLAVVRDASADEVTIMVGDGINDAPALAAADVGVAMGVRGATASSEAADVVLIVDRLDRLVEAVQIARRSQRVATEAVLLGMGLSFAAMAVAAAGYLPPAAGALLQEGIDVAAIGFALRALTGGRAESPKPLLSGEMARRLRREHAQLIPSLDRIRRVADSLDRLDPGGAIAELDDIASYLSGVIVPHERADEVEIYPIITEKLGGREPLAALSRTHQEIFHLVRVYQQLLDDLKGTALGTFDIAEVRRVLYGLHAILQLHFAQEEELYMSLNEHYLEADRAGADPSDQPLGV